MPFEFIQIPANGQGSAKEELNKLLRDGRIASVRKEFVPNGEDSFWAFCIFPEQRDQLPHREPQQQHPTNTNNNIGFRLARSSDQCAGWRDEHGTEPAAVPLVPACQVRQKDKAPARCW